MPASARCSAWRWSGAGGAVRGGLVSCGGTMGVAGLAGRAVPFRAGAYVLVALVVMVVNYERLPAMFELIISSAFGLHAGFGAMLGLAVEWGVKRGIYSNEAGQGTGPHAAAAAEDRKSTRLNSSH